MGNSDWGEVIRDRGLVAVESKLGWLLSGVCEGTTGKKKGSHDSFASTNLISNDGDAYLQEERDDLKAQLACFWETESIGVKGESAESEIYDNKVFLRSIQHDGTRYSVDLPWTAEKEQLPDHEKLCEDRASCLHERLKRNPELTEKYDEIMKEQLMLEPVPEKDAENKGGTVHVLPHHPVVREDRSTTKVRVVYDGSAHTKDNPDLTSHRERSRNVLGQCSDITVGDIVFINRDGTARSFGSSRELLSCYAAKMVSFVPQRFVYCPRMPRHLLFRGDHLNSLYLPKFHRMSARIT